MGVKKLPRKESDQVGRPALKQGEQTEVITFKVPMSLWNQIIDRMEKLEFWSKGAYVRHAIEIEMKGRAKSISWLTRTINQLKQENIELRDQLHDKTKRKKRPTSK